jgi:hypothetical protein
VSALEARVRIREGLSRLVTDGLPLEGPGATRTVNLLLDCCGSDHRPLVDLVLYAHAHGALPVGPAVHTSAWPPERERLVHTLTTRTFLEADAARWAIETLAWAHGRIADDALDPVRPFESVALPAPVRPHRSAVAPRPRAGAGTGARAGASPLPLAPGGALFGAAATAGAARPIGMAGRPQPFGASLRFGQPWYAVQGGALPFPLPTRRHGPRRPPPIAPISGRLLFASWTRQTWGVAGALGAATLLLAVGYWTILNAAREQSYRAAVANGRARTTDAAWPVRLTAPGDTAGPPRAPQGRPEPR